MWLCWLGLLGLESDVCPRRVPRSRLCTHSKVVHVSKFKPLIKMFTEGSVPPDWRPGSSRDSSVNLRQGWLCGQRPVSPRRRALQLRLSSFTHSSVFWGDPLLTWNSSRKLITAPWSAAMSFSFRDVIQLGLIHSCARPANSPLMSPFIATLTRAVCCLPIQSFVRDWNSV